MMFSPSLHQLIGQALAEDIGPGDITTDILIDPSLSGQADMVAKQDLIVAGTEVAARVFHAVNPAIECEILIRDGAAAREGQVIVRSAGPVADLLRAERVALNFLQHLSGIAGLTRKFVEAVSGLPVKILDTRKTAPGLRAIEKCAVRAGGGHNHRFALYDGILIKDNHLAASSSLKEAVKKARSFAPHLMKIEVEVTGIDQLREALAAGAEVVLLDNMDLPTLKEAVAITKGHALLEASGGVALDNVREIAETGVDFISVGALTHSAPAADISMRLIASVHHGP
ncbi:MAG: carboxylating nicotinate-nucleotide diphosphorylase [Pseudomonadota bacterium]